VAPNFVENEIMVLLGGEIFEPTVDGRTIELRPISVEL
jgi:hypothetical protein